MTRGVSGSRLYNYLGFLVEGLGGSGASGFVEIRGSVYRGLTPSYSRNEVVLDDLTAPGLNKKLTVDLRSYPRPWGHRQTSLKLGVPKAPI